MGRHDESVRKVRQKSRKKRLKEEGPYHMRGCVVTEEKPPVVTNSNAIINTSILEKKARHRIRKRNNNLEGEPGQR